MHIIFACSEYPHEGRPTGGFGTYVYNLTKVLLETGHRVSIICRGEKKEVVVNNNLAVYVLAPMPSGLPKFITLLSVKLIKRFFYFLDYPLFFSWAIYDCLLHEPELANVDIIEGGDFGGELFFTLIFKSKFPSPIVIKLHTPSFLIRKYNEAGNNIFYFCMEAIEKFCMKKADALYSPTRSLAAITSRYIHRPIKEIIPYPQISTKQSNNLKKMKQMLLYVGKFQSKKGVFVLAKALPAVLKLYPKAKLYMIGPDTFEENVSIKKLLIHKLQKNRTLRAVTFIPNLTQKQLNKYYEKAEILIVPSLWENYPNVIIEGLQHKCSVVATKVGGIPELVRSQRDALLVPPGNHFALAKAINKLLNNQHLRKRLSETGIKSLKTKLDTKLIYQKTITFYARSSKS